MDAPNTQADIEQALLDWQMRLAEKERVLALLQRNLISWSESLTKMARIIDEVRALQQGEPIASSATVSRPALRLVPPPVNAEP